MFRLAFVTTVLLAITPAFAQQAPDWKAVGDEAVKTLQGYVRINTSNPPGDVTKAADFLSDILKREGIPVTRYESAPGSSISRAAEGDGAGGKAILLDATWTSCPTDRAQWTSDPFAPTIEDGEMWGRGTIDMKGMASRTCSRS